MKAYRSRLMVLKRRVTLFTTPLLLVATLASADTGGTGGTGGLSPLTIIFLGLIAAILLLQLVPALVLFGSMVAAVFKRSVKKAPVDGGEQA